jgi:hypothetical protein
MGLKSGGVEGESGDEYGGDNPKVFCGPGRPLDVCGVPGGCVAEVARGIIWIIEIDDKETSTARMSASDCVESWGIRGKDDISAAGRY